MKSLCHECHSQQHDQHVTTLCHHHNIGLPKLPHLLRLKSVVNVSVISSESISTFIAGKQQNFKAWLK